MLDSGIPHPGSKPERLAFPFAAAQEAIAALDAKIAALTSFRDGHGDAAADVRIGFEGAVREAFDQAFDDGMADIDRSLGELHADVDNLERLVARARREIEARDDDIAAWQQKADVYDGASSAARL